MFDVIKNIHGVIAYLFILFSIGSIAMAAWRYFQKENYSSSQLSLARFGFIFSHIQLLLGAFLWVMHGYASLLSENAKAVMQDASMRKLIVEHPFTNIIAIAILTVGFISIKKTSEDHSKHIKTILFFGISLLLILSRIPRYPWLGN